jgi:hypothetical protein
LNPNLVKPAIPKAIGPCLLARDRFVWGSLMPSLSSFIRLCGGIALLVLVLDFFAYQSARASLAATGPIEIYGRPTALQPWQFYFMLAVFGLIGVMLCVLGLAPLRKKRK